MAWEFKDVWLLEFEYTRLLLEVNDLKETRSLCFLDYGSVKLIIVSIIGMSSNIYMGIENIT